MKSRKETTKPDARKASARTIRSRTDRNVTKSERSQRALAGATRVIAKMRTDGTSLRKAAREVNVAPRTVLKKAASALRKSGGRYKAKAGDRLVRSLKIPTPQGPEEISVRGLRTASLLGRYWVAVHKYYETGNVSALQKFRGESITAVGGTKYPLLTDLDVLNRLGSAGVLSFESLYARSL